uniref:Uncharacterized protein n=1 Tax=Parascaris univalens TaxID=6257 RepID=A0A914ZUU9_PARUN
MPRYLSAHRVANENFCAVSLRRMLLHHMIVEYLKQQYLDSQHLHHRCMHLYVAEFRKRLKTSTFTPSALSIAHRLIRYLLCCHQLFHRTLNSNILMPFKLRFTRHITIYLRNLYYSGFCTVQHRFICQGWYKIPSHRRIPSDF